MKHLFVVFVIPFLLAKLHRLICKICYHYFLKGRICITWKNSHKHTKGNKENQHHKLYTGKCFTTFCRWRRTRW